MLAHLLAALTALAPAAEAPAEPVERRGAGALAGARIAIDPGHNGRNWAHPDKINRQVAVGKGMRKACDTTGTETTSGYTESRFNMSVARKLTRKLRGAGARVRLTRRDDDGVGPCINRRARIGNRFQADAAVSIHADGGPASGRGFHVIYPSRIKGLTDDIYWRSRKLARKLRGAYAKRTGLPPSSYAGSRGLDRRPDLGGLRLSDVPKVFIETGNMRNAADANRLRRNSFRKRIAHGIAHGLRRFLR